MASSRNWNMVENCGGFGLGKKKIKEKKVKDVLFFCFVCLRDREK